MHCIELESLCKRAFSCLGLKLELVEKSRTYPSPHWLVFVDETHKGMLQQDVHDIYVFTEWNGNFDKAIATSIEEVANCLFALYKTDSNTPYWQKFCWVDRDGTMIAINNAFAGKTLEEAKIFIDLTEICN